MKKYQAKEFIKIERKAVPKVWLVTASASGLGRHIAEAVLASGDFLLATARDPGRLDDLVKRYGDQVLTAPLDASDEAAAPAAVQAATAAFGRLDVVVNNAGYGDAAPIERVSWERFKELVDANFYGVLRVTRAALPVMRRQGSGCILQISSMDGRLALPGSTAYQGAKWDVGGFTEALAREAAPFGVRICALEPGGMRSDWSARAKREAPDAIADYKATVASVADTLKAHWGSENSDLAKLAQVILRLAASERLPVHLLLSGEDVQSAAEAEAARAGEAARWREIDLSTDAKARGAIPQGTRAKRGGIRAS